MKERNQSINLIKAIACIGIVFVHIRFPGTFGTIMWVLPQFGVPIFFMIAGYYSYTCSYDKVKVRLFKILRILAFGYFSFFVYNVAIHLFVSTGDLKYWLLSTFNWNAPIKYIVFCTIDFAIPLWYLIAMAETYFVWYYVVCKKT